MKNLVIVESPSKSKTIEKYLGEGFEVVSSKGHIRDLSTRGKDGLGVDFEDDFKATYKISKDKKDVVKELKAKVKKSDHVYLATDPDREGEAISWHLADELGLDIDLDNRVIFNEITKDAVVEAFQHPRKIDMKMVKSQETRRILDRIIGFKLSKLLQSKIKSKSAGRVQSVALKLIVDREAEIDAFIPEEYWSIVANFENEGNIIETTAERFKDKKLVMSNEAEAMKVMDALTG
ncbi:MAG TPA: DNA topoisomerase, partial [Erysipelothrix sp.]|nr:DNA topoisomerase [Erysipelothrix sp.]